MDDILFTAPTQTLLLMVYQHLQSSMGTHGFQIAPEKFQMQEPWQYLGRMVFAWTIRPQHIPLDTTHLHTLSDFQRFWGGH